jgi:cell pole-organizing protein PopZ
MAEQAAENEPSMEEILSSIRRIINEDDAPAEPEAEAAPAAAAPEPEPEPEDNDQGAIDDIFGDAGDAGDDDSGDVLELTDRIDEPTGGTDPIVGDDDLMIVDREEDFDPVVAEAPVYEPMPEPAPEPEPEIDFGALEAEVEDGIMSEPAVSAAMGSFHSLADTIRISDEEGRTLEGVVRALLRPMLKDWLDTNLPAIVDEKVQAEIDRVARRRR